MGVRTCTLHRIAYNDVLDPSCPQCMLAGIQASSTGADDTAPADHAPASAPTPEGATATSRTARR